MLCEMYDPKHVAALVLQEQANLAGLSGVVTAVCLVDVSELEFCSVARLCGAQGEEPAQLPSAVALEALPEASVKRSAELPDSYLWASAMRVMSTRGVCSIYAWRARRLLTLDMEAEAEEDDDNEDDAGD